MSEAGAPIDDEAELGRSAMPFREHLVELRGRVMRAVLGVLVGFVIAWSWHVELFDVLSLPIRGAMADNGLFAIKALQITESITVYMRLSMIAGLFLASPWVFWQLWAFVAPGLLRSEKRLAVPVIAASVFFFFAGAAFCYFVVLPFMTDFLIKMTLEAEGLTLEPTLASTTSYATLLILAFGVVFELPVFMYFLSALGIVTASGLWGFYRYWIVIAAIIGAILTPTPDPVNQLMMSGPLVVLYGLGIGIAWFVEADRRDGRKLPLRGAVALLVLLLGAGWAGARQMDEGRQRDPLADVPREALQLVGVHAPTLDRLLQMAAQGQGAIGIGPLALIPGLGLTPSGPHVWMVRLAEGVALVVPTEAAAEVPARVARQRQASLLQQAGGPSAVFRLRGDARLWRVTAPQQDLVWIGHDEALAALAAVRVGERAGMAEDVRFAEICEELRAAGPLWALTMNSAALASWLPPGVLTEGLQRATAVVDNDGARLQLRFDGRSEADARSVRDRLAVWLAELRERAGAEVPTTAADERLELLTRRLAAVAGLLARVGETAARALPDGSSEAITLLAASNDANRLGRELRSTPPPPPPPPADALSALGLPPQVFELTMRGSVLHWRVEGQPATLIAGLLAPTRSGVDIGAAKAVLADTAQPEAGAAGEPGAAAPSPDSAPMDPASGAGGSPLPAAAPPPTPVTTPPQPMLAR